MMIAYHRLLELIPLIVMLFIAATTDLRTRRIPNWLTLTIAGTGFLQSFLPIHATTPGSAALGFLVGFALNIGLFALHIRGGGDVKLFAGLGAWLGPQATFYIFLVSTVLAAIHAVVQCAASGRLTALFRNTAVLAVSVANPRELGAQHTTRADGTFISVGRPLPYALPVILATVLVVAFA